MGGLRLGVLLWFSVLSFENVILSVKNDARKGARSYLQINGCSAIVTGGTGGMGEATVRRLHAAGAQMVGGRAELKQPRGPLEGLPGYGLPVR